MPKNHVKVESHFRVAREAGDQAIEELIERATDKMHETAEQRLQAGAGRRGYNLPLTVEKETSKKDGKITYAPWYGRFFEFGTVHIKAMPFMRPGSRAGRKLIKNDAPEIFEKWVRRARVRT